MAERREKMVKSQVPTAKEGVDSGLSRGDDDGVATGRLRRGPNRRTKTPDEGPKDRRDSWLRDRQSAVGGRLQCSPGNRRGWGHLVAGKAAFFGGEDTFGHRRGMDRREKAQGGGRRTSCPWARKVRPIDSPARK